MRRKKKQLNDMALTKPLTQTSFKGFGHIWDDFINFIFINYEIDRDV
jgi:hypothetical protein